MNKFLSITGLILAIVDFSEKTGELERFFDILTTIFEELTQKLTRRVIKLPRDFIERLKYERTTTPKWLWWLAMIPIAIYSPIMFFVLLSLYVEIIFFTIILHFFIYVIRILNYPKKGIVGSIGLLLAIIGIFM